MILSFRDCQNALRTAHDDALRLRLSGSPREADLIDQTLAKAFFGLIRDAVEESSFRTLRQMLDLASPLTVDAVANSDFSLAAVRMSGALVIPDLDEITSLDQIRGALSAAISVGAPTYNMGDARGCGIIYWATSQALVNAPTPRGFAGQARALKSLRQNVEDPMPPIGFNAQAVDDFAWRMRRGLDAALAVSG